MRSAWPQNAAFGIFVSANSVLILLYGIVGMTGNQFITAGVLAAPLIVLMRSFRPLPADFLFAAFLAVVVASVITNGRTTTDREYALLTITLAAYPACRAFGNRFDHSFFVYITGAIVAAGTLLTAWAIVYDQSGEIKPLVFGFHEGPTVFLMSLCFLIFALVSINLSWRKLLMIGILIAFPSFVFAAAMVRHPFIALCLTLAALAMFDGRRRYSVAIFGVICLSLSIGLASRPGKSSKLVELVVQNALKPTATCDSGDTVAYRLILTKEALAMIPTVGLVGAGVGSFAKQSCNKSFPHNIVLQTAAELGVAAALILIGLFGSALVSVTRRVRFDPVARFVFAGLVFTGLEFLMSGSLTNAAPLFGFMGWSVGLEEGSSRKVRADCLPQSNQERKNFAHRGLHQCNPIAWLSCPVRSSVSALARRVSQRECRDSTGPVLGLSKFTHNRRGILLASQFRSTSSAS